MSRRLADASACGYACPATAESVDWELREVGDGTRSLGAATVDLESFERGTTAGFEPPPPYPAPAADADAGGGGVGLLAKALGGGSRVEHRGVWLERVTRVLPVGMVLTVVGQARLDDRGRLRITAHTGGGLAFVSRHTLAQLLSRARGGASALRWLSVGLLVAGVATWAWQRRAARKQLSGSDKAAADPLAGAGVATTPPAAATAPLVRGPGLAAAH